MAFGEGLATRVRDLVSGEDGLAEKKMFGGLAMLLHGNMAVGVHGQGLIVRADPAVHKALLAEPGARVFDIVWPADEGLAHRRPTGLHRRRCPQEIGRLWRRLRPPAAT